MDFYHDLITQKSWQLLKDLRRKHEFILIGGWAVFLYTEALKSKDIDLVMEYADLEKLQEEFPVSKNDRLKKYEARSEEVEIDIYVPFYSNPGLPAEDLKRFVMSIGGFSLVEKEILVHLKQKALMERAHSAKGRKDLIDIISLFRLADFDWEKYRDVIRRYGVEKHTKFVQNTIAHTREINELDLNVHRMARLKKRILPLLEVTTGRT